MDGNGLELGAREVGDHVLTTATGDRYFACRIERILTLGVHTREGDRYVSDFEQRHKEFIFCLVGTGEEKFTYDLRIVSRPNRELISRGTVDITLLCRAVNSTLEDAARHALELKRLVQVYFEEYDVALVAASDLESLLSPFDPQYITAVFRRCEVQSLGVAPLKAPEQALRLGPLPGMGKLTRLQEESIFNIGTFLPRFASLNGLFKLMQLQRDPVAVSFRLQPTRLHLGEYAFLGEQEITCETMLDSRTAGTGADKAGRPSPLVLVQLVRGLKSQARARLETMRAGAALLSVELASPVPISLPLVHMVGQLVSGLSGRGDRQSEEPEAARNGGGYDIMSFVRDRDMAAAFSSLKLLPPALPWAPATAERLPFLFDPAEAAAAFRLPPASTDPPSGIKVRHYAYRAAPPQLEDCGLPVAENVMYGQGRMVFLAAEDRLRHVYIVGQTGTGKTTMLRSMVMDDIRQGRGLCVIDPHGDLFRKILGKIPRERYDDVVVFDPADGAFATGLNLLEAKDDLQRHFVVQEMLGIIRRLIEDDYGSAGASMAGPIFYQHARMNLLLVMSDPANPGTLLDFYKIFVTERAAKYWERWMPLKIHDPQLEDWVQNVLPNTDYLRSSDGVSLGGWIASKFDEFVFDPKLRNIFGQARSTIDLRGIMDRGKILLVNLAKGELSEFAARFLGMVLLAKLQGAAMARVDTAFEDRTPFYVYVDEFQNIATESFVSMLSEGRKFGLGLTLANQFVSQVKNERVVQSIFGNVGTLIAFRLGQADAELVEKYFSPDFTRADLTRLPNWHSAMTMLVRGQTVPAFSVETTLGDLESDPNVAAAVRTASRSKYSRPRQDVERELGYAPKEAVAEGNKDASAKDHGASVQEGQPTQEQHATPVSNVL